MMTVCSGTNSKAYMILQSHELNFLGTRKYRKLKT